MIYKKAPLPFRGQKRGWFEDFKTMIDSFPDCTTIIDLFGGSGLLAHWAHALRPDARVIWNDYDGYSERLAHISETNELKIKIYAVLQEAGILNQEKIPGETFCILKQILRRHMETFGYLDYITVSAWILFSGKYVKTLEEFEKEKDFWNKMTRPGQSKNNPYPPADSYTKGLTILKEDWRYFFGNPIYDDDRTLFLLDPPYFFTDGYSYEGALSYQDQSGLLTFMDSRNYCYFTNSNSAIVLHLPEFEGATRVAKKRGPVSYTQPSLYEFMIYRPVKMNSYEKELETACTRYAREKGYLAIKLENTGHTGIPDRLYLKDGRAIFVEFKIPGSGRLSLFQSHWLEKLQKEHFIAQTIRTIEEFKELIP